MSIADAVAVPRLILERRQGEVLMAVLPHRGGVLQIAGVTHDICIAAGALVQPPAVVAAQLNDAVEAAAPAVAQPPGVDLWQRLPPLPHAGSKGVVLRDGVHPARRSQSIVSRDLQPQHLAVDLRQVLAVAYSAVLVVSAPAVPCADEHVVLLCEGVRVVVGGEPHPAAVVIGLWLREGQHESLGPGCAVQVSRGPGELRNHSLLSVVDVVQVEPPVVGEVRVEG
eukprot:4603-Heterococcus_DN1.PRE.3